MGNNFSVPEFFQKKMAQFSNIFRKKKDPVKIVKIKLFYAIKVCSETF